MGWIRRWGPGLAVVAAAVVLAFVAAAVVDISPLVGGVVLGVVAANLGLIRPAMDPGLAVATRWLLRAGVVLLGLRLSFDQVRDLGVEGALAVVAVVVASFLGIQVLARLMGLGPG
ncbi:MAG: putative sulfate exporter family transporter, partial [Ilumatobacteraceae bacterium]